MSLEAIKSAIPHREPFLLIDEIVEQTDNHIVCRKTFTGEEFWYPGHYPNFPLTPGVLSVSQPARPTAAASAADARSERARRRWFNASPPTPEASPSLLPKSLIPKSLVPKLR